MRLINTSTPRSPSSQIAVVRDIPYASSHNNLQSFDLYIPTPDPTFENRKKKKDDQSARPPLICFIHGGAWRSEDKSEHETLARRLASLTSFPVALPNYRLTTPDSPIKHPAHAEDLLTFLHFLLSWPGPPSHEHPYDPTKLYLIGHSCGAHMLTSIFLTATPPISFPSLHPAPGLIDNTQGIILSEGIYDLDLLLESFPEYKSWFVANAFGDQESYEWYNTTEYNLYVGAKHIHWLIIHAQGDTKVDRKQSIKFYEHIGGFAGYGKVQLDESLQGEHNQILAEEPYAKLVADFVVEQFEMLKELLAKL